MPESEGKHLMIMDDEAGIRDIIRLMLSRNGYRIAEAVDGEGALSQFKKASEEGDPFDIVILDLNIPGPTDSRDVMMHMKEMCPEVHGIISSGDPGDPVMISYREYGFSAALPKPFRMAELIDMANNISESRSSETF